MMPDANGPSGGGFRPLSGNGYGMQPIGSPPGMNRGDIHETFSVDLAGNISGGHTTIQIPGGQKIHMPWSQ